MFAVSLKSIGRDEKVPEEISIHKFLANDLVVCGLNVRMPGEFVVVQHFHVLEASTTTEANVTTWSGPFAAKNEWTAIPI